MFLQLAVGLLIGGGVLGWFGFRELRLAGAAKATPRTITCAELGARGPGDNAHVRMTDFVLVLDSFAIESPVGNTHTWSRAWIPAVPSDGEYAKRLAAAAPEDPLPPPEDVRVLVQTGSGGDHWIPSLARSTEVQGTVINEIDSLDSDAERILRRAYPHVRMDSCWILEQGRVPKSAGRAWVMLLGGLALTGGGAGLLVLYRKLVVAARRSEKRSAEIQRRRYRRRRARLDGH